MAKADSNKAADTAADQAAEATPPEDGRADDTVNEQANEPADESTDPDDLAALPAEDLLARLNATTAENAQMKDALLRAKAEVENIRRRTQNEIVASRKYAVEGFARELLGVRDSLDQASSVELSEAAFEAVQKMKEGLGLTLKQLDLAMAKFAVVEVEAAVGVRFDPERHQAISTTPCADIEAGHIVSVMQKGFALKERLLRPAMVVVAADGDKN